MLENTNDYLQLFTMIAVLALVLAIAFYLFNLQVIKKNVQREIKYYGFDRDELKQKSGKK